MHIGFLFWTLNTIVPRRVVLVSWALWYNAEQREILDSNCYLGTGLYLALKHRCREVSS